MGVYVVKSGENIFDVAMKIHGGIEGIFDLIVSNTDAVGHHAVSLYAPLDVGTKINYTDGFVVNASMAKWIQDNSVEVKNGEHVFSHTDMNTYLSVYVTKKNILVANVALLYWPEILQYPSTSREIVTCFLDYINQNSNCIESVTEASIPAIASGDFSYASKTIIKEGMQLPFLMVQHVGSLSSFTYSIESGFFSIDWGDNTAPELCAITNKESFVEHCYEDSGNHVVKIYGDAKFSKLDLRGIGGTYYPLAEIHVKGEFNSDLLSNEIINQLIIRP